MDESASEVQALRAELEALRAEVREMRGRRKRTTDTKSPADDVDEDLSSRRGFLRVAGGAAIAGLIAAVSGKAESAEAATGGSMLIGNTNVQSAVDDTTALINASVTYLDDQTLRVENYTSDVGTLPGDYKIAIAAQTAGSHPTTVARVALYGEANTTGSTTPGVGTYGTCGSGPIPWASSQRYGLVGTAEGDSSRGVFGFCATGATAIGVFGRADEGYGVTAQSYSGISLNVSGDGRMLQAAHGTGAPVAGTYSIGEMIRDTNGEMFICVASGTPGTWRKVAAAAPSYAASGGSINMLSKPIRVLDTRPGQGAPLGNAGPLAASTGYALQITGTSVGGIYVPAGAKGILGNLTVTQFAGPGNAVVYPDGVTQPTASNINFTSPTATIAVANNFMCGLSAAGKLKIWSSVATHAIIDIAGFVY